MSMFLIHLENVPGSLARVSGAIAAKGINITGVAGSTVGEWGGVALTTSDEAGTRAVLDEGGYRYRELPMVTANLEDRPGTLADAAEKLADAGVNVEAAFPTGMVGGKVQMAFAVSDPEAAARALS